nr:5'-nucleotidase [Clostridium formicaceticum]
MKENLPFNNTICTMELKGRDIKKLIERSIDALWGRLQTDGIIYDIVDGEKKIQNIKLKNGDALDLEKKYKVATSDYLADGGDFFSEFQRGCNRRTSNIIIREAIMKTIIK